MFKTMCLTLATLCTPFAAFAAASLPAGQYTVTSQVTALDDPNGLCAPLLPLGSVTTGVATITGLGKVWTSTQTVTPTASPYRVNSLSCSFSALPGASTFSGSPLTAPAPGTATCEAITGSSTVSYTLTTSNTSPATAKMTFLPTTGLDDAFRIDQTGSTVSIGTTQICTIGLSSVFLRVGK